MILSLDQWAVAATVAALVLGTTTAVLGGVLRRVRRQLSASQVEAERLRDLAKGRAERISVLSHEVRTPLALVQGAAELLAEETPGPLNAKQRQFARTITTNARQVVDLAEDLLADARLEATLFDMHVVRTDVRVLVRETVRELRRLHPVSILLDSRGAPVPVLVDRGLMRQAIWNLVNNAVRHAGDGVTVLVRVSAGEEHVLLSVSDDGQGMSVEERASLFTPFAVGSSRRAGTGLGMMITRRIVELHGGRVFVDSVARRGTTIFLSLPREAAA